VTSRGGRLLSVRRRTEARWRAYPRTLFGLRGRGARGVHLQPRVVCRHCFRRPWCRANFVPKLGSISPVFEESDQARRGWLGLAWILEFGLISFPPQSWSRKFSTAQKAFSHTVLRRWCVDKGSRTIEGSLHHHVRVALFIFFSFSDLLTGPGQWVLGHRWIWWARLVRGCDHRIVQRTEQNESLFYLAVAGNVI
jgi:hypothetical protein